jgi:hypothetical protein
VLEGASDDVIGRVDWRLLALFVIGLLISLIMLLRSQVGGDQLNLLARGWLLAEEGVWIQYGNPTSAGGNEPGGLTSLVVGLPLLVWCDYRAPVAGILLFHVVAYALLDRVMREVGGQRLRLIFCLAYWLSPWRIFFSGFLWNPNYLALFSAVHLWTSYRLRRQPSFGDSLLHSSAIGFGCQLHPSATVLGIASALLLWRRRIHFNWAGLIVGAAIVLASLLPYVIAAWRDPAILPGSEGFPGRGIVLVYPLLKGLGMWFRFASLALSLKMTNLDFAPMVGSILAWPIEHGLMLLRFIAGPVTLLASVLANGWLGRLVLRRSGREWMSGRTWLKGYAAYMFGAAFISYALSPTTVMPWQCLPVFPAAVLPLTLWVTALTRSRVAEVTRRAAVWWTGLALLFSLASAFASPLHRSEGRKPEAIPLAEHRMLHDLGLEAQSDAALGVSGGWKSDVLTGTYGRPAAE